MAAAQSKSSTDRLNLVIPSECLGIKILHEPHIDDTELE